MRHRHAYQRLSQHVQSQTSTSLEDGQDAWKTRSSLLRTAVNFTMSFGAAFVQTWLAPSTDTKPAARLSGTSQNEDDSEMDQESTDADGEGEDADNVSDHTFSTLSSLNSSDSSTSSSEDASVSRPPSPNAHARSPFLTIHLPDDNPDTSEVLTVCPPTPVPAPFDPSVLELIRLQSFDGSFPSGPDFQRIVGAAAVDHGCRRSYDESLWAAALAVAYMQKQSRCQN